MKISVLARDILKTPADLLIFFSFEDEKKLSGLAAKIDQKLKGAFSVALKNQEFQGKENTFLTIASLGCLPARKVSLVGWGKKVEFDGEKVRLAGAALVKAAQQSQAQKIILSIAETDKKFKLQELAQFLAEGIILGSYKFAGYKSADDKSKKEIQEIIFLVEKAAPVKDLKKPLESAEIIGAGVNLARDLVNTPPNQMTPNDFVRAAQKIFKNSRVKISILEKKDLAKMGAGAFLAVAQGSSQPAKMLILKYRGNAKKGFDFGLVGKGITFDSGGISLKPAKNMAEMKDDMAGAAAVLAATKALADLKLKINLITVIPLAENMPGGSASKPADVVKALNKKTIEIISTDAEGRLILADALTYAVKSGAKKLIDVATLTGGCVVALGDLYAGAVSNNEALLNQVIKAGQKAGEKIWPLPFDKKYQEYLKSDLADLKNSTEEGKASPVVGGMFLAEFVGQVPWVHLDIAGTAYLSREIDYLGKNATGAGVRTLVYLIK